MRSLRSRVTLLDLRTPSAAALLTLLLAAPACGDPTGAGLQSVNLSFAGRVLWTDGTPVSGSRVQTRVYICVPGCGGATNTDAGGNFQLSYGELCVPGQPVAGLLATCDAQGRQTTTCLPDQGVCGTKVQQMVCTCPSPA
jgi:hypothetical protein